MKCFLTAITVVFLMGSMAVAQTDSPNHEKTSGIKIGDRAPMAETKMPDINGKEYSIKSVAGSKGTLVVFTCNACPYVVAWDARINDLAKKYSKMDIGILLVNSNSPSKSPADTVDKMKAKAEKLGFTAPYVVDQDSRLAHAFGATRTPEAFLFDGNGMLVYHGTIDDSAQDASAVTKQYLNDALHAVSSGQAVEVAETKAMGCSIKWPATSGYSN